MSSRSRPLGRANGEHSRMPHRRVRPVTRFPTVYGFSTSGAPPPTSPNCTASPRPSRHGGRRSRRPEARNAFGFRNPINQRLRPRCARYPRILAMNQARLISKTHIHSSAAEHDVQRVRSTADRQEGRRAVLWVRGEPTCGNDKYGSISLDVTRGGYVHWFDHRSVG
jgi:hypothetical protein